MRRALLLIGIVFLAPFSCKSSADQPQQDDSILNLLGFPALKSAAWNGSAIISQCQNLGGTLIACSALASASSSVPSGNMSLVFSDLPTLTGTMTLITVHPDLLVPTPFTFGIKGTVMPGYETGSGTGQVLKLTVPGTNPVTESNVQAQFVSFSADIAENSLQGTTLVVFPGTQSASVVYTFILKPAL